MVLKKTFNYIQKNQAQSLIELLIVIGLMAILLPAVSMGLIASREGKPQQERRVRAAQLIKESQEAVRSIREASWSNIETNGTYYPEHDGSTWSLVAGTEIVNTITRQIEIEDVQRDDNNQIVESGGSVDPSTKKITITTSWDAPIETSISSALYLTRYLDNATYIQTTEADFNTGTLTDVIVTNTAGGEVTLGSGGSGSWCAPSLTITALDLPKSGVANGVTAIEGRAFAVTGDNASGVALADITISNANPPIASVRGTFDGYKTNDVFGELNYAYIATDNNSKEIVIIDLTISPYVESGYANTPGNSDATGIFVVGNTGYVAAGNKLYNFDLSSKDGSRPLRDPDGVYVSLFGTAGELYVVGNYAYVTIGTYALRELVIVDISNPTNMQVVGWADVNGEAGQEVFVNSSGTRAYLATNSSSSKAEFFIIDISSKSGSQPVISSYDANGMNPKGVTVVTGNKAILVGTGGEEYQVIDITTESAPSRCGGIEVNTGVQEVSSVIEGDGDAYSYIVTGDASAEFKIIAGGPGGTFSSSGSYESATFDIGYSTAFNRIVPSFLEPVNTSVQLQIAVADALVGSCDGVTYEFVGPDGTSGSFYTDAEVITFNNDGASYENPARCFRYRAYLSTSDSSSTPIFEGISINYSP